MLEQEFIIARQIFDAVLEKMPRDGTIGLVHDVDADGVTAGVVWQRVLERLNFKVARLSTNRERNVWTESNREKIAAVKPDFLWVLIWVAATRKFSTACRRRFWIITGPKAFYLKIL